MIVNLIVILLTLFFGLLFSDPKFVSWSGETKRKRYIRLICIILILQSGLRNVAVGADTYAYYKIFEQVKLLSWRSILDAFPNYYLLGIGKDPGYNILQKIVQYVVNDYQVFLLLIAILFFTALGNFIYKNTNSIWQSIFAFVLYSSLFYAFFSITGHRQTIATAATLFSFELIKKRKFLLFILLILIASTIHRSCLIFLPFYFLYNLKRSHIFLPLTLIAFFIIMLYREPITETLTYLSRYEQYGQYAGAGTYTFTAMLLLVAVVAWWRMRRILVENENARPFFNAFIIAIVFTPLTWVNPSAMRVVQYFSIFLLVLIPEIIGSFSDIGLKLRKILKISGIFLLIIFTLKSGWDLEYRFFWQSMDLGPNYYHWKKN